MIAQQEVARTNIMHIGISLHHVKNALSFDEMQLQPDVKFSKRNIVNQRKLAQPITFSVRNMESEKWHKENID